MLLKKLSTDLAKLNILNTKLNNSVNKMSFVNYFADSFIDRCSDKRKNNEWVNEQMKLPQTNFILFHIDKPYVQNDLSKKYSSLYKIDYGKAEKFIQKNCTVIFLGLEYKRKEEICASKSPYSSPDLYDRGVSKAWFAIDTYNYDEKLENISNLFDNEGSFLDGNFVRIVNIDTNEASIVAQARSIFCWHDRNKFCATCGTSTVVEEGGFKRSCPNQSCKSNDKRLHRDVPSNICYPRVDPVVIMLIVNTKRTHFLLGRKKNFPKNMYSCLAGFLEAGESIEEAVKREIFEECGIYTSEIVFHSSQPWPFPSNIMIGCLAYASSDEINLGEDELEEAKWFSFDEIEQILENKHPESVFIPPSRAIANKLITHWFKNRSKL